MIHPTDFLERRRGLRLPGLLVALLGICGATAGAAQESTGPLEWHLPNPTAHDYAPDVYELSMQLEKTCLVRLDGVDVPSYYDAEAEVLLVLCSVPAGGGALEAFPGRKSQARNPKWRKPTVKRDRRTINLGAQVRRIGAVLENGVLRATLPADERVHGRVELEALRGDWSLVLHPLGSSVGCVQSEEVGLQLLRSPELQKFLFNALPSVITKADVLQPNPFQRILRTEAFIWAVQGDGEAVPVIEAAGYDLELTWGSPIVRLRAWRRGGSEYFNHNGVNLNEIQLEGAVSSRRHGAASPGFERPKPEHYDSISTDRSVWIEHGGGTFLFDQPDFAGLGIYRSGLFIHSGRLMSVLSQSWSEGWKPILIPAEDREDRSTLVCVLPDSQKSFEDWMTEIGAPLVQESIDGEDPESSD